MLASFAFASALLASVVSAANHTVIVGGKSLTFVPDQLDAQIGDFVTYIFQAKNHTVTQSGFAAPCKLLENATINAVGFDSGFVPVAAEATDFPAWTIEVTAASPIWFYCAQGNHCKSGMVGSINAPKTGDKTHEAFKALAMSGAAPPPASGASFSATQSGVAASGVATSTASAADVSAAAIQANSASPAGSGAASSVSRMSGAAVAVLAVSVALFL